MSSSGATPTTADVRDYWNRHIHDLEITAHPVGSPGFFADLDQYHFEKLHHLLRLIDFDGYKGKQVLEVGCGAGTDLVRFARGGAHVTGVDVAASAIALARQWTFWEWQGVLIVGILRFAEDVWMPVAFAVLLACLIVFRTTREVGRPLRSLVRHAMQLSRGNLLNRTLNMFRGVVDSGRLRSS